MLPSKKRPLYKRRKINPTGMKQHAILPKKQTDNAKNVYSKIHQKKTSLIDHFQQLDNIYDVQKEDNDITAKMSLGYTIGTHNLMENLLEAFEVKLNDKDTYSSETYPEVIYNGTLDNGCRYQLIISSNVPSNSEHVELKVSGEKLEEKCNYKDYQNLFKAINKYIIESEILYTNQDVSVEDKDLFNSLYE